MTLQELAEKCKGGVYLQINDHKQSYQSVEEELEHYCDEDDYTEETKFRMILTQTMYENQFYLTAPVSSYTVHGATLEEALENIVRERIISE